MKNSIQNVVDNALCTGCGACCGLCQSSAIEMWSIPSGFLAATVDKDKCTDCGLCRSVCPSVASNHVTGNAVDAFYGVCLKAYIGHSTDAEIRQVSQSGGLVTALLLYMLDQHLIDGALVNHYCAETRRPEVVCATTREQIIAAAGSYYSQSAVVKAMLDHRGKRIAAVVLGCQAEAVELIRNTTLTEAWPAYNIGLVCAGQFSGDYADKLIELAHAKGDHVTRFRFRDKSSGGWPGNAKVYTSTHECVLEQSSRHKSKLKPVYEAYRCLLCFDQMNMHSDILAGDPWGIDHDENAKGNTVLIARTQKGLKLINDAAASGYICVSEIPVSDVMKGQTVDNRLKSQFAAAVKVCRDANHMLPVDVSDPALDGISNIKPSKQMLRQVKERLAFSRNSYLENAASRIVLLREQKAKAIEAQQLKQERIRALFWYRGFLRAKMTIRSVVHRTADFLSS